MMALLTCSLFLLVGAAVALHVRPALPGSLAGWLTGAWLLGVGSTGTLLFALGILGVPVTRTLLWVVLVAAVLLIGLRGNELRLLVQKRPRRRSILGAAGLLLIAVPFAAALYGQWNLPASDYDGRTTWMPKAAAIASEHSIRGPFFQGERGLNLHNHYPLLLPLDVSAMMLLAGTSDVDIARLLYLIPLAFLILAHESLHETLGAAAWMIAIAAWLPPWIVALEGGASSGYADLTTAAFFGLAVLAATGDDAASAHTTGLWLTFLILTKSEGVLLAMSLLGALIVCGRIRRASTGARIAAGPFLAIAALAIWRRSIPEAYDHRYGEQARELFDKLPRFGEAVTALGRHALSLADWGLVWYAVAAVSIWSVVRRRDLVTILTIAAALLAYGLTYTMTTWDIRELASVSAHRLLSHLVVPGLLVVANALPRSLPSDPR